MPPKAHPVQESEILRPKALFVHPGVHRRLKKHLATKGGYMQQATEEAVTDWLDKKETENTQ
ncbi:MAG: hypothetical protein RPU15_17245 [Candidatus Sedimenticola sp. (ex Thyasira tokunagai)]